MHNSVSESSNVNGLITELCRVMLTEQGIEDPTSAKKLKAKSFEILLHKYGSLHSNEHDKNLDAVCAIEKKLFQMKLKNRHNPIKKKKCEEIEEKLDMLKSCPNFTENGGCDILQFLFELHPTDNEEEINAVEPPDLLVPGAFTLFANYHQNLYFPKAISSAWLSQGPCYFPSIKNLDKKANPYLPRYFVDGERNLLRDIEAHEIKENIDKDIDVCTFTGMTRHLFNKVTSIAPCGLDGLLQRKPKGNNKRKKKHDKKSPISKNSAICYNWAHLGCNQVSNTKPFASKTNVALYLESLHLKTSRNNFEAKILDMKTFLRDLKLLTVGNESNTFRYEKKVFRMQKHLSVEGTLTTSVENFVLEFLECGTCFKRLQHVTAKHNFKLKYDGFMFKALCGAVDEYLVSFKQFIFSHEDTQLLSFYQRTRHVMKHLVNLYYTLGVHSDANGSKKPLMGSRTLGHLYNEIMYLTDKDYIALIVFMLRRCCRVYFGHLQKWIFCGILDDPFEELMICYVGHYRSKTKFFYDRAYQVRTEGLPGFLAQYQQQILMSGKYTMLLKAHKPNHPIFKLQHPVLPVCMTLEEVQSLQLKCEQYYKSARELCGNPVTIRDLFEWRAAEKSNFLHKVGLRTIENMEKWNTEQRRLAKAVAEKKQKRFAELTAQLKEAEKRKFDQRRNSVLHQLRLLKEAQHVAEQHDRVVNVNLRKRIEYYQELNDILKMEETKRMQKLNLNVTTFPNEDHQDQQTPTSLQKSMNSIEMSDVDSCAGDDVTLNEFISNATDDLFSKYSENEEDELCVLLEAVKGKKMDTITEEENANTSIFSLDGYADPSVTDIESVRSIRRSVSDFINSNEPVSQILSELELNRQRVMSSTNMNECMRSARKVVFNDETENQREIVKTELTEAQRNKLRVLTQEYGAYRNETLRRSLPDINLNTIPEDELTDLQRNRRRMMNTDTFRGFNEEPTKPTNLKLDLESDLQRIRRKVLASEFDIVLQQNFDNLSVAKNSSEALTPMSTTSDTPLTENAPEVSNEKKHDLANGNISATTLTLSEPTPNIVLPVIERLMISDLDDDDENDDVDSDELIDSSRTLTESIATLKNLKLNVDLISLNSAESKSINDVDGDPLAATLVDSCATLANPTPESALNTAGLVAKRPFEFPFKNEEQSSKSLRESCELLSNNSEDLMQEEDSYLLKAYDLNYTRCQQLIHTRFQCAPCTPYFKMKKDVDQDETVTEKQMNVDNLSVITLTESLKQSVVIPMTKHLEIVNGEVMRMFLMDLNLLDHIRSLRHYYFLMDGEFASHICDGIISKLEEGSPPEILLNYQTLHATLENALGSSLKGNTKNASNLSFIVSFIPSKFDLNSPNVLDVLSLSYRINWPLSLILNPETMEQYGNIFRYLFKVRRISWILERAFQILKEIVKSQDARLQLSPQYRHIQQIRHKFYHFVNALQNHITAKAMQASWKTFKDELLCANCIEDIYRRHTIYIKRILFLCMLNRSSIEFYNTIENIFKILLRFSTNLKSREFKNNPNDEFYTHPRYHKMVQDEIEFDKCIEYTIYLGKKIVRHGYQTEIGEFINLINFNNYYKERPAKK